MQVRIPQLFEEIAANKPHGLQIDRGHNCYAGDDNTQRIEHQSVVFRVVMRSSLCNLCVLCVSVVSSYCELVNHRDTETQRLHREDRS